MFEFLKGFVPQYDEPVVIKPEKPQEVYQLKIKNLEEVEQSSFTHQEVYYYTSMYFNICVDKYVRMIHKNCDHWEYYNYSKGIGRWKHEKHEVVVYLKPTSADPNPVPRYLTVPTCNVWSTYNTNNRVVARIVTPASKWLQDNIQDIEKKIEKSREKGYSSITVVIDELNMKHIDKLIEEIQKKTDYTAVKKDENHLEIKFEAEI